MPTSKSPLLTYICGGLMFSLAGILFKPLVGIIGPLEVAAWRSLIVLLALLLIRYSMGRSPFSLPLSFSRWQCFSAAGLTGQTIFFSTAISLVSTADTFLISNAVPIYMVFWQVILERRTPTKLELLIIAIASMGLFLFFADSLTAVHSTSNVYGLCAAFVAGISFAAHIYGQGRVGKEGMKNGEQFTMGSVLLGSAFTLILALLLNSLFGEFRITTAPSWALLCLLALGVFQFAIPMMLWARSLPFIPPLFAAFMPTLIAIWAPCLTYLLLKEPFPSALTLVGAAIVHLAVLTAAITRAGKR